MSKSYYCEKLNKTLHFLPDGVKFCCSCASGAGFKVEDVSKIDKQYILDKKNKYIDFLKRGQIPSECRGCIEYKEITFKDKIQSFFKKEEIPLISHIVVDHFSKCDCDCSYCSQKKFFPNENQTYELLPIIQKLYQDKMIDLDNLKVEFQGGNVSVLDEFELLLREFYAHNCDDFVVMTNAIKYLPEIEKYLQGWKNHISISLDAGTKETFYKIKKVDAFDAVIQNIKLLREKIHAQISLKYIIIKGVNDNKEELEKFLLIAKEIGNISPVILEIDYNDTFISQNSEFKIPKHYYEMFEYAEKYCKENEINYLIYPYTKSILEKGHS